MSSETPPGLNDIPPEIYKRGDNILCKQLDKLFILFGLSVLFPQQFKDARVIRNRIILHLSQCEFPVGLGTAGMIFSIRQVANKVREKNQELNMAFVDLIKTSVTVQSYLLNNPGYHKI